MRDWSTTEHSPYYKHDIGLLLPPMFLRSKYFVCLCLHGSPIVQSVPWHCISNLFLVVALYLVCRSTHHHVGGHRPFLLDTLNKIKQFILVFGWPSLSCHSVPNSWVKNKLTSTDLSWIKYSWSESPAAVLLTFNAVHLQSTYANTAYQICFWPCLLELYSEQWCSI